MESIHHSLQEASNKNYELSETKNRELLKIIVLVQIVQQFTMTM